MIACDVLLPPRRDMMLIRKTCDFSVLSSNLMLRVPRTMKWPGPYKRLELDTGTGWERQPFKTGKDRSRVRLSAKEQFLETEGLRVQIRDDWGVGWTETLASTRSIQTKTPDKDHVSDVSEIVLRSLRWWYDPLVAVGRRSTKPSDRRQQGWLVVRAELLVLMLWFDSSS